VLCTVEDPGGQIQQVARLINQRAGAVDFIFDAPEIVWRDENCGSKHAGHRRSVSKRRFVSRFPENDQPAKRERASS
jgi:hypothetical protein